MDRDLRNLLVAIIQTARLIPDRENGGIIVLLDPHDYMNLEDMADNILGKDNDHDGPDTTTLEDAILGTAIK